MDNIGAYLQVYKRNSKVDLILPQFRKVYPESTIYLVSDAGDDFSDIAEQNNCIYEHSTFNTGVKIYGFTKIEMLEWLSRLYRAFSSCKEEYVLYLEDDVFIRRQLDISKALPNNAAIAGINNCGSLPTPVIQYISKKYNINFHHNNGGACGGTVYNRQTYLDLYENITTFVNDEFDILFKIWNGIGYLDQFLPLVYMRFGYKYETNYELYEPLRHYNWRSSDWGILHFNCHEEEQIMEELKNGSR